MEDIVEKSENELMIIANCTIKGRKFVITVDKKVYVKGKDNKYREYSNYDEKTEFLKKYTKEPKSLDIYIGDER